MERSVARICFQENRIILLSLVSRGDVARNDFTSEDDQLPEEPEYDKFAYENDRKMWGIDNSFNENDGVDGLRGEARKQRRLHYTSGTVSLTRKAIIIFEIPGFFIVCEIFVYQKQQQQQQQQH